jgi:hypothetical protein
MKREISREIFDKYTNIKFQKTRRVGAELFHVDSRDEANSRFSQFCERT